MNRRALIATAALIAIPGVAAATESSNITTLRDLIDQVIANGDMSNLESLVSTNVAVATLGVGNIDDFRAASMAGYEGRSSDYSDASFEIVSIAEDGAYVHALVHFTGTKTTGRKESRHVFYVARFSDDLIASLYIG